MRNATDADWQRPNWDCLDCGCNNLGVRSRCRSCGVTYGDDGGEVKVYEAVFIDGDEQRAKGER